MDKDFMLTYYDKMVRPIWTELMKTPRYQRAAGEHDKLEREFRRLLDEKLGRKYLELDDEDSLGFFPRGRALGYLFCYKSV